MESTGSFPLPSQTEWVLDTDRYPSVYTRPLHGSERWMHDGWVAYDGIAELCFAVNFTSSLGPEEMTERTRRALDKLRFVCPIIACAIEGDVCPKWVYTPSVDREAWLDLVLTVEQRGPSLDVYEFSKDVNLSRLPHVGADGTSTLVRVYLLVASKEGDDDKNKYALLLHGPHAMMDGGPTLHAVNLMLEFMSGSGMDVTVVPSKEWRNLPVDIIAATGGLPAGWETSGAELLEENMTQAKQMFMSCHRLPPPTCPLDMSQRPIRHSIVLSESETRAVSASAKKLGVSLSALFRAANGLAQLKVNPVLPENLEDIYFPHFTTSVSPERYLKPSVNPKTYLTSSLCVMPLRIHMAEPLKQGSEKATLIMTAKKIQEKFDKYLSNPCLPITMPILAQLSLAPTDPGATPDASLLGLPWQCDFQNLGVVEARMPTRKGNIIIENIWPSARVATIMSVRSWTMHKKLYFQVEGAAAWGEEFLKTMLEETIRIGMLIARDAKM